MQGRNAGRVADHELANVHRIEAVHVLGGIDPIEHPAGVDLLGQRQLDQDTMHRGIGVQPVDRGQQFGLAGFDRSSSLTECIPASRQAFSLLPT